MRLAATLGLGIITLAAPASARTFECSFQTLRACSSDMAAFCPGITGKEQRLRIEAPQSGNPITGVAHRDGAWKPVEVKTSDYLEMGRGRIVLFGSPNDAFRMIIVDKPTGAKLDFSRTKPTVAYVQTGHYTVAGGV